ARGAYGRALALGQGAAQGPIQCAGLHHKIGNAFNAQKRVPEAAAAYERAEGALGERATGRPSKWWRAGLGIQLDRIAMHYWQSQLPEMAVLVEQVRPVIGHHGTPRHRAEFFRDLTMLGLLRELFVPADETLADAQAALAAAREAGVLSVI